MKQMFSTNNPETIAILGGTGGVGTGFAIRWGRSGHTVIIGSRVRTKAETSVARLSKSFPDIALEAMENREAAQKGDVVVLTVPAAHQMSTLASVREALKGKVLVDATVPLVPPRVGTVQLPPEGSAGKRAQDFLGDEVMVVSAFQNVAADLMKTDVAIECDVLVSGNKKSAREKVVQLAKDAGVQAWHAGPIDNAAAAEALTSILIQINKRYPISHSGIKIVGGSHD